MLVISLKRFDSRLSVWLPWRPMSLLLLCRVLRLSGEPTAAALDQKPTDEQSVGTDKCDEVDDATECAKRPSSDSGGVSPRGLDPDDQEETVESHKLTPRSIDTVKLPGKVSQRHISYV